VATFSEAIEPLTAIACDFKLDAAKRASAAKYLGYLNPKASGKALLAALEKADDAGLEKELIRTLSLINMKEAESEIEKRLDKGVLSGGTMGKFNVGIAF